MVDGLWLLLGGVTGQSRNNPLQLLDSNRMEAPKDSATIGTKAKPSALQSSAALSLVLKSN